MPYFQMQHRKIEIHQKQVLVRSWFTRAVECPTKNIICRKSLVVGSSLAPYVWTSNITRETDIWRFHACRHSWLPPFSFHVHLGAAKATPTAGYTCAQIQSEFAVLCVVPRQPQLLKTCYSCGKPSFNYFHLHFCSWHLPSDPELNETL